jgi:hypothetical protein
VLRVATAVLLLVLLGASPAEAAWRWPLRGEVRRPFAVTADHPYAAGQHRGGDLAAPPGAAVRSACSGRVRFAGRVGRLGRVVSVRCGGLVATYLDLGVLRVVRGAPVAAGQRLGSVGAAGGLHLGARHARSGRYVDPLTLLRTPRGPSLGPAPGGAPRVRRRRPAAPAAAPVPSPAPVGVPVVAWIGLALVAGALPAGGLLVRHRSRQRTSWTSTSPSRRWTSSER